MQFKICLSRGRFRFCLPRGDLDFVCLEVDLEFSCPMGVSGLHQLTVSLWSGSYRVSSNLGVRTPVTFFKEKCLVALRCPP